MSHPLFEPDEKKLKSVDDFFHLIDAEYHSNAKHFGFRGHRDSEWQLKTTLARLIEKIKSLQPDYHRDYAYFSEIIREKLERNFRENVLINGDLTPEKLNNIDVWQYGQHHGLPSPLLDWTRSPFVALYFAICDPSLEPRKDRCIWIIDKVQIGFINDRHLEKNNETGKKQILEIIEELDEANRRLIFQQGFFTKNLLFPSIESWLGYSKKSIEMQTTSQPMLRKVTFNCNESDRVRVMDKLNLMNINSRTLFPDIAGSVKGAVDKVLQDIQLQGSISYSYSIG